MITLLEAQRLKDAGFKQGSEYADKELTDLIWRYTRWGQLEDKNHPNNWSLRNRTPGYDKLHDDPFVSAPNSDEIIVAIQDGGKVLALVLDGKTYQFDMCDVEDILNAAMELWKINRAELFVLRSALVALYCKLDESQPNLDS